MDLRRWAGGDCAAGADLRMVRLIETHSRIITYSVIFLLSYWFAAWQCREHEETVRFARLPAVDLRPHGVFGRCAQARGVVPLVRSA